MKHYEIELIAQSLSFYYESIETVYAESLEQAKEKAIEQYSKRTLIHKSLIKIF